MTQNLTEACIKSLGTTVLLFILILYTNAQTAPPVSIEQQLAEMPNLAADLVTFTTAGYSKPKGGHLQGIQQLSDRHLVISGSSSKFAYFFVVEWPNSIFEDKQGKIISLVKINDDFPDMLHNHSGGIQLMGNYLAIGTEGGKDPNRSSVVFYDLNNPNAPKPLQIAINRGHDTAGAVAISRLSDNSTLLAVGGWDSDLIDFYKNDQFPKGFFTAIGSFQANTLPDYTNRDWGPYQNLNLITEEDVVYLFGFCRKENKNLIDMHGVTLDKTTGISLSPILRKPITCGRKFSLRFGGGIAHMASESKVWVIPRNWKREIGLSYHKVRLKSIN